MPGDAAGVGRNAWVESLRPARHAPDPRVPHAFFVEPERSAEGSVAPCATVLITNAECPWRCVMCDLWKNTLPRSAARTAVAPQIAYALERLPAAHTIKLYNSGSFFDQRAIDPAEYPVIAEQLRGFSRVIVESHPALVNEACLRFRDLLDGRLEIAIGLETAHPEVLARLNKGFTLERFAATARFLAANTVDLRVFLLVGLPYLPAEEQERWVEESLRFALDHGATAVSCIATRGGNGAMEQLAASGAFAPPRLSALERAVAFGVGLQRARVFADLWEPPRARECAACFDARVARLHRMNVRQTVLPAVACAACAEMC